MRRAPLLVFVAACCHSAAVPEEPATKIVPDADEPEDVDDDVAVAPTPAPTLRLPDNLSAVAYQATLSIDPSKPDFRGELTMVAQLERASSSIWLNADRLTIDSATAEVGGETLTLEARPLEEDFVELVFPRDLAAGPITLHVVYQGVFEMHDSMGAFVQPVDGASYVFTQFEALGARRAFPCIDEPSSKVPWTLTLQVPVGQEVFSNTPIASDATLSGVRQVTFETTPPLPSYLVAFAVGPFETVDAGTTPGGAPIRVVTFHGHAAEAKIGAKEAAKVMAVLEDYFGTPYPYAKLDLVPIPSTTWFSAMENPGMITFTANILQHETWTEADRMLFAWDLAHEGAHQWFGDLVTMAWWDDLWLNEAFATWMEEKALSKINPDWMRDDTAVQRWSWALAADGLVTARKIHQPIEEASDIQSAFDGITYNKGAAVIRMFERWVGADAFRDGVRAYLAAHATGNATSDDFLASIDAVTDLDVTSAFRTFLDQAGAPRVSATLSCAAAPSVTLRQDRWLPRGSAAPAGEAPRWTIPVCVAYGDGKTRGQACTTLSAEEQTLALDAACPTWILPNADAAGYYRVALDHDGLAAVLDHGWAQLTGPERLALAYDVGAMVARGDVPYGDELDVVARLVTPKWSAEAMTLATSTAWGVRWLASGASAPKVAAWIRDTFGKRAAKLGWTTGKSDSLELQQERAALVSLVATAGQDKKLRQAAVAIMKKWPAIPEADRARIAYAAVPGNPKVRDQLIKALESKDQQVVRDAAYALGAIEDPDEARPVLEALLDPDVDLSLAGWVMGALAGQREVYPVAAQFLRDHFAELRPRIPDQLVAGVIGVLTASCDAADRAPAEAWATDHIANEIGAPRAIANALEGLDQCVAQKAALAPELDAWLAKRKK